MFDRVLKRLLAYLVASALGGGGIACAQVMVGDGVQPNAAPLSVDASSSAAHVTIYRIDGSAATPGDNVATYHAATSAFSPPATPTDVFTITGSLLRVVRVLRLGFTSTQSTAGTNDWFLLKRSSPDSSGLGVTVTSIFADRKPGASVLTQVQGWTANPTVGNLVGLIWHAAVYTPLPAETLEDTGDDQVGGAIVDFKRYYGEPLILRDNLDTLALNFNGAALPTGLSVRCWVEWSEDLE